MDGAAFYKISYGLFVVSSREGVRDNAFICNTLTQVANSPTRVSLAVNKLNYTCWAIDRTGLFNATVLTQDAPFALFQHFGFQSGADVDKFVARNDPRSENGLVYLSEYSNAYFSAKVVAKLDLGSHLLFIGEVTDARVLSSAESITYDYYQKFVKPKSVAKTNIKGWRCKICGFVYENETLPSDFVCPVCKHGAVDFEKIE